MYQRDFIMRMVEMLAELVAGIFGLIKKGEFDKAAQSIDNAYRDLLKEDAAFFTSIPINELGSLGFRFFFSSSDNSFSRAFLNSLSIVYYL